MSEPAEDLSDVVRKLHASYEINVKIYPDAGKVHWVATISGEDFLDGYWKATRTGSAKNHDKALKAAVKLKKNERWVPRYRDRGEWTAEERASDKRS